MLQSLLAFFGFAAVAKPEAPNWQNHSVPFEMTDEMRALETPKGPFAEERHGLVRRVCKEVLEHCEKPSGRWLVSVNSVMDAGMMVCEVHIDRDWQDGGKHCASTANFRLDSLWFWFLTNESRESEARLAVMAAVAEMRRLKMPEGLFQPDQPSGIQIVPS